MLCNFTGLNYRSFFRRTKISQRSCALWPLWTAMVRDTYTSLPEGTWFLPSVALFVAMMTQYHGHMAWPQYHGHVGHMVHEDLGMSSTVIYCNTMQYTAYRCIQHTVYYLCPAGLFGCLNIAILIFTEALLICTCWTCSVGRDAVRSLYNVEVCPARPDLDEPSNHVCQWLP